MKIGIDISILKGNYDGIGFYTLKVLDELNNEEKDTNEYYLYSNVPVNLKLVLKDNFKIKASNTIGHVKWLVFELKKILIKDKIDVFWQPNYLLPFKIKSMKQIITVHDLSGYSHPEYVDYKTIIKQRLFLKKSCRFADLILTDSNFSKMEILKEFGICKDKVKTVYLSLITSNNKHSLLEELPECLNGVKSKYFLFVGTLAPRKNDKVLIEAYKKYVDCGGSHDLVLAGKISKKSTYLFNAIEDKYSSRIHRLGYINESTKELLYDNCACVVYPSRLEGFGIPILEAMNHGKLVITSNNSSIPEVAEDAALYLTNIDDVNELTELLIRADKMEVSLLRSMVEKGYKRVAYFEELNFPKKIAEYIIR